MKLSSLLKTITPVSFYGTDPDAGQFSLSPDPEIGSIHFRSQDVEPGGLFVAIKGLVADGHELVDFLGGHGQGHSFLGLGNKDLPGLQATVFQWGTIEVHLETTGIFRHLTHRRRQSTGTVVSNCVVEATITGDDQEVKHAPLRDRIADLHRRHR